MNHPPSTSNAVIVGAGLAGLVCARVLQRAGVTVKVFEASDDVGGRVRSDRREGFILDRGFQILLRGYPEIGRHLDLEALDLRSFQAGARVWHHDRFEHLGDPLRDPRSLWPTLRARCSSLGDKLAILRLRHMVSRGGPYAAAHRPDMPTRELLRELGFTPHFVQTFFRPFLGGIFLEPDLGTSSRFFEFVFRMFSMDEAVVPAKGMGMISQQLAAGLLPQTVQCDAPVARVHAKGVTLSDGSTHAADAVFVGCQHPAAAALVPSLQPRAERSVTNVYFDAPAPPASGAILHLRGTDPGPVNNLHVPSEVSPHVAPPGRALVSVTCLGLYPDPERLLTDARAQLTRWFGPAFDSWRILAHYSIAHALPAQPVGALEPWARPNLTPEGVFVCGDHLDQASIDGAMASGRRAAEAYLARDRDGVTAPA